MGVVPAEDARGGKAPETDYTEAEGVVEVTVVAVEFGGERGRDVLFGEEDKEAAAGETVLGGDGTVIVKLAVWGGGFVAGDGFDVNKEFVVFVAATVEVVDAESGEIEFAIEGFDGDVGIKGNTGKEGEGGAGIVVA